MNQLGESLPNFIFAVVNLDQIVLEKRWTDGESWPYDFVEKVNRGEDLRWVGSRWPLTHALVTYLRKLFFCSAPTQKDAWPWHFNRLKYHNNRRAINCGCKLPKPLQEPRCFQILLFHNDPVQWLWKITISTHKFYVHVNHSAIKTSFIQLLFFTYFSIWYIPGGALT